MKFYIFLAGNLKSHRKIFPPKIFKIPRITRQKSVEIVRKVEFFTVTFHAPYFSFSTLEQTLNIEHH
jgi:hypothetical protein